MSEYTFLFKENNTNDRDCVRYVDVADMRGSNGRISVCGACYSSTIAVDDIDYDNITTILSKEDFALLGNSNGEDLSAIINKLQSDDNNNLFEQVQEEEAEYLMDEFGLDEDDIKEIFSQSGYYGYKDRSLVGRVYDDAEDCGYEEAYSLGYIGNDDGIVERYFDFEAFGNDLVDYQEGYISLNDGRVVYLNCW